METCSSRVRVLGAAAAHLLLVVLGSWVSNSLWSAKNAVLFLVEVISFAAIHKSDPGYIPIHQGQDSGGEVEDLALASQDSESSHRDISLVPLRWSRRAWRPGAGIHDRIPVAPATLRCFCELCNTHVPLRSQHCSICNRCVAQFDRHELLCGCVGERNRTRFLVWLMSSTALLASMIQDLWGSHNWLMSPSLFTFLRSNASSILVTSVFWSLFLFFFSSLAASICLMATNLTFYEATRHRHRIGYLTGYGVCDLPYDAGIISNAWHFIRSDGCFHRRWLPEEVSPPGERQDEEADCITKPWSNRYYSCC